jgi:hypothetical protein
MSPLSESAVESIARHCSRVTNIGLSMNRNITGAALIPLLSNVARAEKLTHLDLSLKQVIFNFSSATLRTVYLLVKLGLCVVSKFSSLRNSAVSTSVENRIHFLKALLRQILLPKDRCFNCYLTNSDNNSCFSSMRPFCVMSQ